MMLHPNDSEFFSGGLGAPSDPAPFAGGQGRSGGTIEAMGRACAWLLFGWLLLSAVIVGGLMIARVIVAVTS